MPKFVPGNQLGKGRPKGSRNKKTVALEYLLSEELGTDGIRISPMQQVVRTLVRKAKKGCVRSAEIILNYAYGKPRAIHEVTAQHGFYDMETLAQLPTDQRLKMLGELKRQYDEAKRNQES